MADTCPGSRRAPHPPVCLPTSDGVLRSWCPCCGREYALTNKGVLRNHQGLPKRPDGGCPYKCPDDCDFDCYFEKASA